MSYGLDSKCHVCKLKDNCLDSVFVQAAISGIHQVNWANLSGRQQRHAHLGAGTIKIDCINFDDESAQPEEK
jgi:hypothetical protein